MKKFILLIATGLAVYSCNSSYTYPDAENSSTTDTPETLPSYGYFQVNGGGTKYNFHAGVLQGHKATSSSEKNIYTVGLIDAEQTVVRTISLHLQSPYNTPIDGTYKLSGSTNVLEDTSSYSEINSSNNTLVNYEDLTVGTCTIKNTGGTNYNVSFSIKPSDGKTYSGNYSGPFSVQIQ